MNGAKGEDVPNEPLSTDEQKKYVAAVFELVEAGQHEAAEALGEMVESEPDKVRAIMNGTDPDSNTDGGDKGGSGGAATDSFRPKD